MMKRLVMLAVLGPLAAVCFLALTAQNKPPVAPQTRAKSNANSNEHSQSEHEDQNSPKTPSVVVQVDASQRNPDGPEHSENLKIERENVHIQWILAGLTGLLVGVGVMQSVALILQAVLLRLHGKHLHTIAGIAERQTEHMVASERAWILIHKKRTQLPVLVPIDSTSGQGEHHFANCMISLKNFGKTPAYISACEFELRIGESRVAPPSVDVYETRDNNSAYPVAPNESWPVQALLKPYAFIQSAELEQIRHGGRFLWMCGIVRYRDVFTGNEESNEHWTKICLFYEAMTNSPNPYWIVGGPSEYNRAT